MGFSGLAMDRGFAELHGQADVVNNEAFYASGYS